MPVAIRKSIVVAEVVDFAIEKLIMPAEGPVVLHTREWINAFRADKGECRNFLLNDGDKTQDEHRRLIIPAIRILRRQYKRTCIPFNALIRSRIPHGQAPKQDKLRDKMFYLGALPSASHPAVSTGIWPRSQEELPEDQQHPAVFGYLARMNVAGGSRFLVAAGAAATAHDNGTLSKTHLDQIREKNREIAEQIENDNMPLFHKPEPPLCDGPAVFA